MINYQSSPTLNTCTFENNNAEQGGGMCNVEYSNPTLENCIFTSNSAILHGGGMNNYESDVTLTNCIFENNNATYGGGAISISGSGTTMISQSTICDNSVPQIYGPWQDEGDNCINDICTDTDGDGTPDCTSLPFTCIGDFNNSGFVDEDDLSILMGEWGTPGIVADLNVDGIVNVEDLLILTTNWNACP
jgi:predicted outer membrane repeat protein